MPFWLRRLESCDSSLLVKPRQQSRLPSFIALFIRDSIGRDSVRSTKLKDELYELPLTCCELLPTAADSFAKDGARAGETLYMSLNRIVPDAARKGRATRNKRWTRFFRARM